MVLKPLHRRDLIKKLKNLWWEGPYSGGRHDHMYFSETGVKITIPNVHSAKDIAIPLQKLIIKELDIDQKTFELL